MFGALKNLGDIKQLMGQAREMQEKAAAMQEELETIEVEGQSGAGLVSVRANAKGRVTGLSIDASLMKPEEVGVVEDLIVAALADAQEKAAARQQEEMQKLMGGMDLPPGLAGAMGGQ